MFSTNTDGCCFKWALVLLKHDKVRDDTPLVKKVWRSSNASALPFFSSQDNRLFMYQLPIKRRCCWERHSSLFVLLCVHAELEKWKNDDNSLYQENSQDQFINYFLLLIPRYLLVLFCFLFLSFSVSSMLAH